MTELETSGHLFQAPSYRMQNGDWTDSFSEAVRQSDQLSWDPAALMGILSLNYPTGDRTLFKEISRRPWLSSVNSNGDIEQEEIPQHGRRWVEPQVAAVELERQTLCVSRRQSLVTNDPVPHK